MDELVQYFVVNKELEMSAGKMAAQVAHVATLSVTDIMNPTGRFNIYQYCFYQWMSNGQKKIILKGKQKDLEKLISEGFYFIRDNGLTEIPTGSLTVVGLPPMKKSDAQKYVKRLQLF
jgi:peptidyl-tRNA hydrolase